MEIKKEDDNEILTLIIYMIISYIIYIIIGINLSESWMITLLGSFIAFPFYVFIQSILLYGFLNIISKLSDRFKTNERKKKIDKLLNLWR